MYIKYTKLTIIEIIIGKGKKCPHLTKHHVNHV